MNTKKCLDWSTFWWQFIHWCSHIINIDLFSYLDFCFKLTILGQSMWLCIMNDKLNLRTDMYYLCAFLNGYFYFCCFHFDYTNCMWTKKCVRQTLVHIAIAMDYTQHVHQPITCQNKTTSTHTHTHTYLSYHMSSLNAR